MSWQACDAVKSRSAARSAHRAVLFVMACYADQYGGNCFPSLDSLVNGSGASRETVVKALRGAEDREEIKQVGRRPSGTYVYSLAPLMESEGSSTTELLDGSEAELVGNDSSSIYPPSSSIQGGSSSIYPSNSSASEHDQSVDQSVDKPIEKNSPLSFEKKKKQVQDLDQRIAALEADLPDALDPVLAQRCIDGLKTERETLDVALGAVAA